MFLKDPLHARWHVQTLHLACVHMQDSELVDQIIIHACSNNPQAVTVDLMKEFLLGTLQIICNVVYLHASRYSIPSNENVRHGSCATANSTDNRARSTRCFAPEKAWPPQPLHHPAADLHYTRH